MQKYFQEELIKHNNPLQRVRYGKYFQLEAPPTLIGYNYSSKRANYARNSGQLLTIRIETSKICDLNCIYCYTDAGKISPNELSLDETLNVVDQAFELGVESIVIIGAGEPTQSPFFFEIIEYIYSKKITPVVFTNGTQITKDIAIFLYKKNCSIIIKLDSLIPQIQDFLANEQGTFKKIQEGLRNLIQAGFTKVDDTKKLRLGISFVTTKKNIDGIINIWKFCRNNNIYPNQEILTPDGRGRNICELIPSTGELKKLKLKLLEIDRFEYGYDWLPYTPLTGCGCLQFLYSLCIDIEGYVMPCAGVKIRKENIRDKLLKEILNTELFQFFRHIDKNLKGKCSNCEYISECIGCRGSAYTMGINQNKDPIEALCDEDPFCFKEC
ncbi:MAG: radical SAM protein [Candidatus Methanoperedens sp.]